MNHLVRKLILSTGNAHKVQEIRALLSDAFEYATRADFPGAPRVEEDADTFAGNAAKKASHLAAWLAGSEISNLKLQISNSWVLADDSGLEVDALNGAPGVHSARFAAMDEGAPGNSPDEANNAKLFRLLKEVPWERRTARFRCVIALATVPSSVTPGQKFDQLSLAGELPVELFDGTCEGQIGFAPKGNAGFGYDPLFVPIGFEESFAELGEQAKNQVSHRAKAILKLRQWLDVSSP